MTQEFLYGFTTESKVRIVELLLAIVRNSGVTFFFAYSKTTANTPTLPWCQETAGDTDPGITNKAIIQLIHCKSMSPTEVTGSEQKEDRSQENMKS